MNRRRNVCIRRTYIYLPFIYFVLATGHDQFQVLGTLNSTDPGSGSKKRVYTCKERYVLWLRHGEEKCGNEAPASLRIYVLTARGAGFFFSPLSLSLSYLPNLIYNVPNTIEGLRRQRTSNLDKKK
ncbi:hypothetical protein GGS21DRAFT_120134 [Xylaria nigripes]|nr:hypothetical protein GGS21DRAFT_120134 [Xylaria nigripes]